MLASVIYLIRPFLLFSLLLVVTLFIARTGLGLWQIDRFDDVHSFATLLVNGLRIDLSTLGYLLILPALIHPWLMRFPNIACWWLKFLKSIFFIVFICVLFFELATPAFINEYGFRPNRLFIEYLVYPNEVLKMLLNGHLLTLVIVILLLVLPSKIIWHIIGRLFIQQPVSKQNTQQGQNFPQFKKISIATSFVTFMVLLLVLFSCARGTLGHRPINPALVYFSTDPLVNSLTLNSIYSVAHAYKQFGNEKNAAKMYGEMATQQVIEIVQRETGLDAQSFQFADYPSLTTRLPVYRGKPKNLVIILEESLGAQFIGSLGGLALTPKLDKLSQEGWAFKHLYATGTRSVRGIEAVITGFTPTAARAVVKLDKSQHNFFTIASLLKSHQYRTQFIYGGESHFDNMKSFFLGNGFTDIVDFNDIKNPQFVASWGASDEDVFNQANIELNQLHQDNQPFFSFIFSSSNHDPFEIPEGIISPIAYSEQQLAQYDAKELARHQAIQYADHALGKFIAKAKTQAYWQDTVFLIVADHDARALGSDLVPINNFHIPAIILNGGKEKSGVADERVVSQIDLAPTLLSLIGVENTSPMIGYDLNNPHIIGRAMMQYADNFAYMKGHDVTILQPQKPPMNYVYDDNNHQLISKPSNKALEEVALAHALWGSLAYEREWYKTSVK